MLRSLIGGLIAGPGLMALGIFIAFWFGFPTLRDAKKSNDWPHVMGVIDKSEVESSRNSDGDRMYSALVEYHFEIEGEEYKSSQISYSEWSTSSSSPARKLVKKYPQGSSAKVFYNPKDPAECVLEPGASWTNYLVLIIGLGLLLIGLCIVVYQVGVLLIGGAVLGGAVTGMIGKKPGNTFNPESPPHHPPQDIDDDAFDIS